MNKKERFKEHIKNFTVDGLQEEVLRVKKTFQILKIKKK